MIVSREKRVILPILFLALGGLLRAQEKPGISAFDPRIQKPEISTIDPYGVHPITPSQDSAPLADAEKREVLDRLVELRIARAELSVLHGHLDQRDRLDAREKAAWERSLELEKKATALAGRETAIERQRAEFAEAALKAATRGRSVKCRIGKLISLGLIRCD